MSLKVLHYVKKLTALTTYSIFREITSVQMSLNLFQSGSVTGQLGGLVHVLQDLLGTIMGLSKLIQFSLPEFGV